MVNGVMNKSKYICPICNRNLWWDMDGYNGAKKYLRCIFATCHQVIINKSTYKEKNGRFKNL